MTWPILSIVIFLPLVGAAFILALRGDDEAIRNNARWTALWTTLLTFFISIFLITGFDRGMNSALDVTLAHVIVKGEPIR